MATLMSRQRGASLIVSLIFLVIMAMLGVTLASMTGLEERMAGGTRDRNLALQAAEAALHDARTRLTVSAFRDTAFPDFDPLRENSAAFWEECFNGEPPVAPCAVIYEPTVGLPTLGAGAVAEQPRFVIERKLDATAEVFLVTARAVGGTTDAIVVLQAEYGYTPPPPP